MPGVQFHRRGFIASAASLLSITMAGVAAAEAESDTRTVPPASTEGLPAQKAAGDKLVQTPAQAAAQTAGEPAPTQVPAGTSTQTETGLPLPKGKVILSVSGKITVTNTGTTARFDRDMLENLGLTRFTTTTPWYNTPVTFEGVRLDRLMKVLGASGDLLRARALDDYTTEIPIADFERYQTILAMKRDGHYMPVTDKGPLFIVYPFDSNPDLKHQRFYARSAWQVARMIVT